MTTPKTKRLVVETPQGTSGNLDKESIYSFNYTSKERSCEVALGMPIRSASYTSGGNLPYVFQMNKPEGYVLSRLQKKFAKLGGLDDMRLLAITGGNQIGRLQYREPDQELKHRPAQVSREEVLFAEDSQSLFDFLADTYLESGISGFQPKVMIPDRAKIGEKSTAFAPDLIIKAAGDDYPSLAQNEFLCMDAAKHAGILVPDFWLSNSGEFFVMSRFDLANGAKLGFEDMLALMQKPNNGDAKYQSSYENIATVVKAYCGSETVDSLKRLFEYVALSSMVRNGDAHLKNFGLIYDHPSGAPPALCPLYDVVTTTVYQYESQRTGVSKTDRTLALKMTKKTGYPTRDELIEFGRAACMESHPGRVIDRISEAMSKSLAINKDRVLPEMFDKMQTEWDGGRLAVTESKVFVPKEYEGDNNGNSNDGGPISLSHQWNATQLLGL